MIKSGYYTTEKSDLYFYVQPKYTGSDYTKAKITLYYKEGTLKDVALETNNYKVYHKNISHWVNYKRS